MTKEGSELIINLTVWLAQNDGFLSIYDKNIANTTIETIRAIEETKKN